MAEQRYKIGALPTRNTTTYTATSYLTVTFRQLEIVNIGNNVYQSLVDNNIGNELTDTSKWVCLVNNDAYTESFNEAEAARQHTFEEDEAAWQAAVDAKLDEINAMEFDDVPTPGSVKAVKSGGLYLELNSSVVKNPDLANYYRLGRNAEEGYVSKTNRVSIHLTDAINVQFKSFESGYRAAVQQWSVEDPTVSLADVSGTFIADSGWLTSAQTVQKASGANYVVVCISKTNDGNLTTSDAYDNVSFQYNVMENNFDILESEIDAIDDKINGVNSETTENNDNASSAYWAPYSASTGGTTVSRGRYKLLFTDFPYDSFVVSFSVAENAPIKCGGSILKSGSDTSYAYDTGWVTGGNGASFSNVNDPDGLGIAVVLNTTYVEDATAATTFEEFLQYVTFSVVFTRKVNGIIPDIEKLKKKCYLSTFSNAKMVAHRGYHQNGIPENSIDAYRWAGLIGYELAETDFCPTSDNELVLMHDASINRTMRNASDYSTISGTVNVNSKTLAQLRANYVLASDDVRYRRPIPTLEEYFITCRESGLFAIPEIKTSGTSQANVLAAYNLGMQIMGVGKFGFCSFSYALLDYARTLDEKLPLWYIGESILGTNNSITGESRETPYTVWYPSYNGYSASASLFKQYKAKGMQVAVWTVPVSEFDNVLKMGADYIAADNCGANTEKTDGDVYSENDMVTNGVKSANGITLAAGNYAKISNDEKITIGIYYISVIAQGQYTITAPNLSVTLNDADYTRHIFQGVISDVVPEISITATSSTVVQFANIKIIRVS